MAQCLMPSITGRHLGPVSILEQLERLRSEDNPVDPAASWLHTLLSPVGSKVKTRSNDLEDIGQGQRSSHATHPLMIVITRAKYKKNPSRTTDATERTRFSKSRSNDLEDIGQGQRSSHATHLLMLVIICTKYGKNPSGTVDDTAQTRFSRPRPNDIEDIGQGQRSLYATHPLILAIICAKYGKNPSRTVYFFSKVKAENF